MLVFKEQEKAGAVGFNPYGIDGEEAAKGIAEICGVDSTGFTGDTFATVIDWARQFFDTRDVSVPANTSPGDYRVVIELARALKDREKGAERKKAVKGLLVNLRNKDPLMDEGLSLRGCEDAERMLSEAWGRPAETKICTGFPMLDSVMSGRKIGNPPYEQEVDRGGMVPHGLYVLAGGTGQGKTALALQIARKAAEDGFLVAYAALEMSRKECVARLVASVANGLAANYPEPIQMGDVFDDSRMEALEKSCRGARTAVRGAASKVARLPIRFIEGNIRDMGAAEIVQKADEAGCRLLIVDYLQICSPDREHREDDMQMLRRSCAELKNWAKETGNTVLLLSSINRANYSTRQGNDALKGSGDIEYGADCVLMLDFEWPVNASVKLSGLESVKGGNGATGRSRANDLVREYLGKLPDRPIAIRVTKNRHGVKGLQHACFHASRMSFDALPGEYHGGMTANNWTTSIIEGVCGMVGEKLKEGTTAEKPVAKVKRGVR